MRFEDLPEAERERASAAIRAILGVETERGRRLIEDDNAVRAASDPPRPLLTNGPLAAYYRWPVILEPDSTIDEKTVDGEILTGCDGRSHFFSHTHDTTYFATKAQWSARSRVLGHLETLGITGEDAEADLCRWFIATYGVVTLVVINNAGVDEALVGFRSDAVGTNQGMLTLPGGFVQPNERLRTAARRELRQEGGGAMPVQFHPEMSWGPHNVAPANLTFVARARGEMSTIHPCPEWKGHRMRRVTMNALCEAACNANDVRLRRELDTGAVKIAPDVIGPLRPHLEAWLRHEF